MRAAAALALALFVVACMHDWERYDVSDASAGGGGAATAGNGVGGQATESACQEVCSADRNCPELTESPTCLEDCASRLEGCGPSDIETVAGCGTSKRTHCVEIAFTTCVPGCY